MTLQKIQDQLDTALGELTCGFTPTKPEYRRFASDKLAMHFVRYVSKHPPENDKDKQRCYKKVSRRVGKEQFHSFAPAPSYEKAPIVGFVPILILIGEALFTWLCEKAFEFLWQWYFSDPECACQLAVHLPYWTPDDEE